MINREAAAEIFVNERESRAGDLGVAADARGNALHELSFAGAEVAFQRQHRPGVNLLRKFVAKCFGLSGTV